MAALPLLGWFFGDYQCAVSRLFLQIISACLWDHSDSNLSSDHEEVGRIKLEISNIASVKKRWGGLYISKQSPQWADNIKVPFSVFSKPQQREILAVLNGQAQTRLHRGQLIEVDAGA